jgi:hypothetical protein
MSGTSMAAPFVAGTIALMFQAARRPLPVRRTRELLLKVAEPVTSGEPQRRWGSGYINVREAIAAASDEGSAQVTPRVRRERSQIAEAAWRLPRRTRAMAAEHSVEALPACRGIDEKD